MHHTDVLATFWVGEDALVALKHGAHRSGYLLNLERCAVHGPTQQLRLPIQPD
jgi:hypothetical protein